MIAVIYMSSAIRQTFYRVMTKEFCMMERQEHGGGGGAWGLVREQALARCIMVKCSGLFFILHQVIKLITWYFGYKKKTILCNREGTISSQLWSSRRRNNCEIEMCTLGKLPVYVFATCILYAKHFVTLSKEGDVQ